MPRHKEKEKTAVKNYCEPTSKTFNDLVGSLISAGYSELYAKHKGWLKLREPVFIKQIEDYKAEIWRKDTITREYIQQEHERYKKRAEEAGDWHEARLNLEGLGKTILAYGERFADETEKQRELDTRQKQAARRIALAVLELEPEQAIIDAGEPSEAKLLPEGIKVSIQPTEDKDAQDGTQDGQQDDILDNNQPEET